MGIGTWGRQTAVAVGKKVGRRVLKYVAPAAPFIVTPIALGAALSAGAMALFFHLADDIRSQDGVWRFDHDGLKYALALRNPRRTAVMQAVSTLARPDIMTIVGIVSLLVSLRSPKNRAKGVLMAVGLAGGGGIIALIKTRYARERPNVIEVLAKEGTFSFPSGHAFGSLVFYSILAHWWIRTHEDIPERVVVSLASGSVILLTGSSRVYLGVHYPSDVLAGYAAAIPWLTACLIAYDQYDRRLSRLSPRKVGVLSAIEDATYNLFDDIFNDADEDEDERD